MTYILSPFPISHTLLNFPNKHEYACLLKIYFFNKLYAVKLIDFV